MRLPTQVSEYPDIILCLKSKWLVSGTHILAFDHVLPVTGRISLDTQMDFALQLEKFLWK